MIFLKAIAILILVTVFMGIVKFGLEEFRKIDWQELKKGWNNED